MKIQHQPWHWAAVAAVLAVALLTLHDAHGQSGSAAVYQGRPAMSGAQAGLGAMSGPPQGGVGPQSVDEPGGGLGLRRPRDVEVAGPVLPRDPGLDRSQQRDDTLAPQRDRDSGDVVKRERNTTGAKDQMRSTSKAKRAVKRDVERARHGVSGVDSAN
ncbi:hypothetical protein [Ramlibacter humi]|uniref:Uncharacterized protein n=1 Tax=Ramlibacter humi TaxID=2530451 RepID=A0A4Z0BUG6_9BURK|nr:hypothetical protein [Ramlibacter humi]TFZ01908.1 hypothetical protein EZ216_12015 [Ramlibacter humi]